jgi:hypothetical protein
MDNGWPDEVAAVHRRLWWCIALMLLLMGINKQLDLQTLITEVGKVLAKRQGWYEQRRAVQVVFIGGVVWGGVFFLLLVWRIFQDALRKNRMALAGLVSLVGFIMIRATSFHGVDRILGLELSRVTLNGSLELIGIAFIWISAARQLKRNGKGSRQPGGEESIFL